MKGVLRHVIPKVARKTKLTTIPKGSVYKFTQDTVINKELLEKMRRVPEPSTETVTPSTSREILTKPISAFKNVVNLGFYKTEVIVKNMDNSQASAHINNIYKHGISLLGTIRKATVMIAGTLTVGVIIVRGPSNISPEFWMELTQALKDYGVLVSDNQFIKFLVDEIYKVVGQFENSDVDGTRISLPDNHQVETTASSSPELTTEVYDQAEKDALADAKALEESGSSSDSAKSQSSTAIGENPPSNNNQNDTSQQNSRAWWRFGIFILFIVGSVAVTGITPVTPISLVV